MARWTPVPVAGGAYSDDCLPWASQDTVNYIPVMAEKAGTRSPSMLRCLPGCTTFSVTGSNAPVRGARNVEGRLLAVSGNALYLVGTDGAATSKGVIPGVARCSLAHNQVTGGNEVAIANGQSGYIYNTALDTLTQITDEGFPGAKVFGFVDGFLMFIEPMGRFFGWSDLAAGTSYNTLDRSQAEAQPDRIVTGIESHGEWLVLGERSGEFYRNTGATTGTFQRIPGTTMEVGCAGTHAVGKVDNSVIWVDPLGTVYRLSNGYSPQRISTHAIEQQLSRVNLAQAFVTVFEDRGHKVWYLTCPDGKTWGYDVATGEWHRRKSDGLNRWRMNTLTYWNGAWIAGDFSNGRLYQLDWAIQHEAGAEMERRRIFPVMHDNQNRLTVNAIEFVFDTGLSEASTPEPTPLLSSLTISGNLPDGISGMAVSYAYASAGGVLPHTFSILSGALPAGLTMSASGAVTGTRSSAATATWTVRVTDADGTTADLADTSSAVEGFFWDPVNNVTLSAGSSGGIASITDGGTKLRALCVASSSAATARSTVEVAGSRYVECDWTRANAITGGFWAFGVAPLYGPGILSNFTAIELGANQLYIGGGYSSALTAPTFTAGVTRTGMAVNDTLGKVWFRTNAQAGWIGGGDPALGTGGYAITDSATYPTILRGEVLVGDPTQDRALTLITDPAQWAWTAPEGFS